jgi:ADP-ribose pyrophosphatase
MTKKVVKILQSRKIYSGDISIRIDKFKLSPKTTIEKEIVEHPPSVGIIPITNHNRNILLVTQYRHAAGQTMLEIPAGTIKKDETPDKAALREMAEETGYTGKLSLILRLYLAPGYDTESMYIFMATNLRKLNKNLKMDLDDDEYNIKVKSVNLTDAVNKCVQGEIEDCKTVASILTYSKLLGFLNKKC